MCMQCQLLCLSNFWSTFIETKQVPLCFLACGKEIQAGKIDIFMSLLLEK